MTHSELLAYIRQGGGICGACGRPVEAVSGFSSCHNYAIECGERAERSITTGGLRPTAALDIPGRWDE